MRFPDWLYKLLPGDAGSQLLGAIWREATASAASVSVGTTVYQVPSDKCLVLTNVSTRFSTGVGEALLRRRVMADPPAGTTRYNITDYSPVSELSDNWQGEVVIPPGWKVRVEGDFTPGAAVNSAGGEIFGYLIPRGSFIFA